MPLKSDTPLKTALKNSSSKDPAPVSYEDLMGSLKACKNKILSSNKALSHLQAKQYLGLKADFTRISSQMLKLKAENEKLCKEIDMPKGKISSLECNNSTELSK